STDSLEIVREGVERDEVGLACGDAARRVVQASQPQAQCSEAGNGCGGFFTGVRDRGPDRRSVVWERFPSQEKAPWSVPRLGSSYRSLRMQKIESPRRVGLTPPAVGPTRRVAGGVRRSRGRRRGRTGPPGLPPPRGTPAAPPPVGGPTAAP